MRKALKLKDSVIECSDQFIENLKEQNIDPESISKEFEKKSASLFDDMKKLGLSSEYVNIVLGVILVVFGIFLAFTGRLIFKAFLCISGSIVFGSISAALLFFCEKQGYFIIESAIYRAIILMCALIGAIVFLKYWKFAVFCLSSYGGMLAAFWILALTPEIGEYVDKIVFIAAFSILAGVTAYFMDEMLVIISSSLIGAFAIFFGMDLINPLGFREYIEIMFEEIKLGQVKFASMQDFLAGNVRIYMLGVLLVTVVGIYVQYRHQPRSYERE